MSSAGLLARRKRSTHHASVPNQSARPCVRRCYGRALKQARQDYRPHGFDCTSPRQTVRALLPRPALIKLGYYTPRAPAGRLSETAKIPVRGSRLAAGYDLSSAYDLVVPARGKALVKTDLEMAIPEGCYGRVGKRAPPHTLCRAPPLHVHATTLPNPWVSCVPFLACSAALGLGMEELHRHGGGRDRRRLPRQRGSDSLQPQRRRLPWCAPPPCLAIAPARPRDPRCLWGLGAES